MATQPTSFAGKRRPAAAIQAKKDRYQAKSSTQPAPSTRPKRAFGVVRNNNILIEKPITKPLPTQPRKPLKPSEITETDIKKETDQEADNIISKEKSLQDEGVHTPATSLIKIASAGTPYLTAETCSKCRFDKLESSAYWLAQVKIAESTGKHFVSAAFFRLALECHSQPFHSLQKELKHYVARHKSISSETLWNDLCKAYGLSSDEAYDDPLDLEKLDAVLVGQEDSELMKDERKCDTLKDECFAFDIIDDTMCNISEQTIELLDTDLAVINGDFITEEFVNVNAMSNSSKENEEALNQKQQGLKISGEKLARNRAGAKLNRSIQLKNKGKQDGKLTSSSWK
ncbi:uncharacterized protein LOC109850935 [Asparagus officinalis]|nr:uncharacterized protein LOC109850935 [Asparagus officinalis]XP_020276609.1 uncharacterized protein LOC109850935 [Asparagus officinalis]